MRVALTGVSGFLGSYIAHRLSESGHRVTGLVRESSRRDHVQAYVDRFVTGEQSDERVWPDLLEGTQCIIHNSIDGQSIWDGDLERHLQTNLVGAIKLLEFSAPRQFIYISSIAAHHDMSPRWNGLIDEDHPLRPGNWYGALKASIEAHLWAAHFESGRHVCALRPCAVYGIDPKLDKSHGYSVLEKLMRGETQISKPGGGKFVHIDDVAAAVVATISNPASNAKVYNLVDCYARWADWAQMAAEELGVNAQIDMSSPAQPNNMFSKDAVQSLGVRLNRGHKGIRAHVKDLAAIMKSKTSERAVADR
jgi:nucleoside-diphosphate-sugar epimerase